MEQEEYKNKKRNTGINKRPGHFLSYMYWTGTKKNYHGGEGFVTGSLRSVLMGVWVKAGRGRKGNKGEGKPSVRDVGTVRGGGGGVENYNGENMRDRNKQVRDKINSFEIFPLKK